MVTDFKKLAFGEALVLTGLQVGTSFAIGHFAWGLTMKSWPAFLGIWAVNTIGVHIVGKAAYRQKAPATNDGGTPR